MPRVAAKPAAAEAVDPFFDVDTSRVGLAELHRRKTADHETVHVLVADQLGWTVSAAEISANGITGVTHVHPPAGLSASQERWERLVIWMAPTAVANSLERQRSGSDEREGWDLAVEIVADRLGYSRDAHCLIPNRDVWGTIDKAWREAYGLAATARFQALRRAVREMLHKYGRLDRAELDILLGKTKPESAATVRKTPKPTKACTGCGFAYTPHHASGKCGTCRR